MSESDDHQRFELTGKRIFVAGHRGMVGSALVRRLGAEACDVVTVARQELDLTRQDAVEQYLETQQPDAMIVAAAKVGGIAANDALPADFLFDNLAIELNLIHGAYRAGVEKLLFLGSSCVYPRLAPQPISEDALLSGPLEPTNEWYAVAKIAGIKLCQAYRRQHGCDFVSAMPTNLYGPGDNFEFETSHVIPALIAKFHDAKLGGFDKVMVWGSGTARREFLHVDDCADALVTILEAYSDFEPINVGSGNEIEISALAKLVADVVDFQGRIVTDPTKPDGAPRKLLNGTKLEKLNWRPGISLDEGIRATYAWFLAHQHDDRAARRR